MHKCSRRIGLASSRRVASADYLECEDGGGRNHFRIAGKYALLASGVLFRHHVSPTIYLLPPDPVGFAVTLQVLT